MKRYETSKKPKRLKFEYADFNYRSETSTGVNVVFVVAVGPQMTQEISSVFLQNTKLPATAWFGNIEFKNFTIE